MSNPEEVIQENPPQEDAQQNPPPEETQDSNSTSVVVEDDSEKKENIKIEEREKVEIRIENAKESKETKIEKPNAEEKRERRDTPTTEGESDGESLVASKTEEKKGEEEKKEESGGILSAIGDTLSSSITGIAGTVGGIWDGVTGNVPKTDFKFFEGEFGNQLFTKKGEGKSLEEALGESSFIGLYFGALQASECPKYQNQLFKTFEKVRSKGKKFVVVYVSCDKAEDHFNENVSNFPSEWFNLRFTDWKRRIELVNRHHAKTIPHFLLFAPNGDILTEDKKWPAVDESGDSFPWKGETSSCTLF